MAWGGQFVRHFHNTAGKTIFFGFTNVLFGQFGQFLANYLFRKYFAPRPLASLKLKTPFSTSSINSIVAVVF
jgi:hypothetical protein